MYSFVGAALFACFALATSKPAAENDELFSKKFSEMPEVLTEDPRYVELEKEAERVVKRAVHNVTVETATLMNKIISKIDLTYINIGKGECMNDAQTKLIELKGTTLNGFGNCPEQKMIEQQSWALAIHSAKLVGEIRRASQESLSFCMKKDNSKSVVCRINPVDETTKRFESLKTKVDEFAANSTKLYTEVFLPFANNCYDDEQFNLAVEAIKNSCPNSN